MRPADLQPGMYIAYGVEHSKKSEVQGWWSSENTKI